MEPRAVVVAPRWPRPTSTRSGRRPRSRTSCGDAGADHRHPRAKIRVIAPDVGGGFGSKLERLPRGGRRPWSSRKLGRPVKWTESRSEGYQATIHGRDQIQDIEIAATADGKILGLKVDLLADMGAYLQLVTPGHPGAGRVHVQRHLQDGRATLRCTGVFTTKTPTDAYRGAGRPEATYAHRADHGRRSPPSSASSRWSCGERNWIKHEEFPYTTIAGLTYDSGNYEAATEKAWSCSATTSCAPSSSGAADRKDPVQLGIGISTFTEMCGLAPSRVLGSLSYGAGGWEAAKVRDAADRQGRGRHRHLAARPGPRDRVEPDRRRRARRPVRGHRGDLRRHQDPRRRAWTPTGRGRWSSAASRCTRPPRRWSTRPAGSPRTCSRRPRATSSSTNGTFSVKGSPEREDDDPGRRARGLRRAQPARRHGADAGRRRYVFDPENFSYPHGTHLCAVEVDTETGMVTIRKYVAVDDIGNVVNPHDRRGPGARRPRPGHRPGAVRGGRLRRRRQPGDRHAWSTTWCPSAADLPQLRHRPHRDARRRPTRSGSRASARPARSPRLPPSSTRSSTRCATRRHRTSGCRCTPERVWRAIARTAGDAAGGDRAAAGTVAYGGAASRLDDCSASREGDADDPRRVRLRAAGLGRRGGRGARRSTARTPRCWPAARACCRCCGCGWPTRRRRRPRRDRRACAGSGRTATGSSSAR